MAIRRIEHFAIAVKDMEKSLRFSRDLLGMKLHSDKISSIEEHANIFRDPSKGKRRHVQLAYGEGPGQGMVVVTEMPGGSKGAPIMLDEVGISHISFEVEDVPAIAQKAKEACYQIAKLPSNKHSTAYPFY